MQSDWIVKTSGPRLCVQCYDYDIKHMKMQKIYGHCLLKFAFLANLTDHSQVVSQGWTGGQIQDRTVVTWGDDRAGVSQSWPGDDFRQMVADVERADLSNISSEIWISRWWQLKYFLCSPRSLGKGSSLTRMFLKWGETSAKKVCPTTKWTL